MTVRCTGTATVTVSVTPVNDAPTLDSIADPAAILEDATEQTVNLSGISAGGGETHEGLLERGPGGLTSCGHLAVDYHGEHICAMKNPSVRSRDGVRRTPGPRGVPSGLQGRPGVGEQVVSRLEFEAGEDRDQRTAAIRAERERLAQAPGGAGLRERVLVGAHGKNVVEWYREEA